jgi:hypothetical protein
MRIALALAMMSILTSALASETGHPTGDNCNLTSPPEAAGEVQDHGVTLRVFPRARDINGSYKGCQMKWASNKGRWDLVAVVSIVSGDPVRLWSPEVSVGTCVYDKGELVRGDARNCPDAKSLISK